MFKRFLVLLLALAVAGPIVATRAANPLGSAISYLQTNYAAQSADSRDWAAIALGENSVSATVSAPDSSLLLNLERNALARAAQGAVSPSEISQIEAGYSANQFGDPSLVNDDIFGVLAIAASDPSWLNAHQGVFATIAATQRSDGSFGFSTNGNGDADITSAAIWALKLATNSSTGALANAANFLQTTHNADGGFAVLPGETSNIATSSWAMIAQTTLGQDTLAVRSYLFSQEQNDGAWQQGSSDNYLNTAYAVMALSGQKLPYNKPIAQSPANNGGSNSGNGTTQPANQPASKGEPSNDSKTPTSTGGAPTPAAAPVNPAPARKAVSRVIRRTITTTFYTTCSASASASASGDNASASASASCD